jgi:hypothetical protein
MDVRCPLLPSIRTLGMATLAVFAACTVVIAQEETVGQDLQGVLPQFIPNGLTEGDFNELGGNWTDWAAETGRLVSDFYVSENDEVRGRRQTLDHIQLKLSTLETALSDPQYLPIHEMLADLYGRLSRRIAVADGLLRMLESAGAEPDSDERLAQLRTHGAELLMAIEEYSGEPTTEYMLAIRNDFDDLRRDASEDAEPLTQAMRHHFLNFNLRVLMDEALLQDLVHDTRLEAGYINEMTSGAHITGCQWTHAAVNLDLRPSEAGARFDLLLNGTICSTAQGDTSLATVFANGRHQFAARKMIAFDGNRFSHWRAAVYVGGAACPYAAETCLSWAPLLGVCTESLVLKIANERQFDANVETLYKIRREVGLQFDQQTSELLQEAELALEERIAGPLRENGYYPDVKEFRTTETELLMRSRLMESGELGGSAWLPVPIYPTHGALIQVHESLLSQVGDRLELEGRRFTPEQLREYLRGKLEALTGRPVEIDLAEAADTDSPRVEEIIFHETDAMRFQIRRGEVIVILSMGLKLEGREEIPPQRILVPLQFSLKDDSIVMERGTVGVRPIGPVPLRERGQQIARAGIMRSKIQEAFEPRSFESAFSMDVGEKALLLQITDLRARGGWLSVIATDGITAAPTGQDQPQQQAAGTAQPPAH